MTVGLLEVVGCVLMGNLLYGSLADALDGRRGVGSCVAAAVACAAYLCLLADGEPWQGGVDFAVYLVAICLASVGEIRGMLGI